MMMKEKYTLPSRSADSSKIDEAIIKPSSLREAEGGYCNPCSPTEDDLSEISEEGETDEDNSSAKPERTSRSSTLPLEEEQGERAVSYKPKLSEIKIINPDTNSNHHPPSKLNNKKHKRQEGICNCRTPQNKYIPPQDFEGGNCCPCCHRIRNKWNNWSRIKRRATRLGVAAAILITSTILGLVAYSNKDYLIHVFEMNYTTVCDSQECILAAADILSSIDSSVSPCDNFYKFACGGWENNNPIPPTNGVWNRFYSIIDKLHFRIKGLLETTPDEKESRSFTNARKMFKACINQTHWDSVGVKPLVKTLKDLGGFPVMTENWNGDNFDWLKTIAIFHKRFGITRLISALIGHDEKDSSRRALYLDQGRLVTNLILIAHNDSSSRYYEMKWMKRVIDILLQAENYEFQHEDEDLTTESPTSAKTTSTYALTTISTNTAKNISLNTDGKQTNYSLIRNSTQTQMPNLQSEEIAESNKTSSSSDSFIALSLNSSSIDLESADKLDPTSVSTESPNVHREDENATLLADNSTEKPVIKSLDVTDGDDVITDVDFPDQILKRKTIKENKASLLMMREELPVRRPVKRDRLNKKFLPYAPETIDKDIEDMWNFYVEAAQIMEQFEYLQPEEDKYNPMTIEQLMNLSPQTKGNINWLDFFQLLFEDTQTEVTKDFNLIVVQPKFFQFLPKLIEKTPKRVLSNAILYLLLIEIGNNVSPNLRSLTTRNQNSRYIGRTSPRPWFDCAEKVLYNLEYVVTNLYMKKNYDDFQKDAQVVKSLVTNFTDDLIITFNDSSWMDAATRKEAVKKVVEMTNVIGFTPKLLDQTTIEATYYHFPEMSETDHFSNMLYVTKYYSELAFSNFNRSPPSRQSWSTNTLDVNAIYSFQKNSIQIPSGILQPPFYRRNTITPLLYGSIGLIIGHEILHGFDVNGRTRNWKGDLHIWWSNNSLMKYEEISACYEKQYNHLPITHIIRDETGQILKVNGIRTKAENIADNEGMALAWRVYKKMKTYADERIKGLENYSSDQLFFITAAQMWCANFEPTVLEDFLKYGSHTPEPFRVNGVVRNNENFAESFNCEKESLMVSDEMCKLW